MFPHHECEIAQSQAFNGTDPVRYWMHNNLITIDGQKMGKSYENFITLEQLFSGEHPALEKAYSPMNIRFFILQAHYRSPLDFSNTALQAAEKGLKKLLEAGNTLQKIQTGSNSTSNIKALTNNLYEAMDDDFNSPIAISHLFEAVRIINSVNDNKETITAEDLELLKTTYNEFVYNILGLKPEAETGQDNNLVEGLMELIIEMRKEVRNRKDWATSDLIRDKLSALHIQLKDGKEGTTWNIDI
jgi:cysteinyl-tRNA synthetase